MSRKLNTISCYSCDRLNKQFKSTNCVESEKKTATKVIIPRKVLVSKKLSSNTSIEGKSFSTGVLTSKIVKVKTKRTTKSDVSFDKNKTNNSFDYCKKCGDSIGEQTLVNKIEKQPKTSTRVYRDTFKSAKNNSTTEIKKGSVQQYFKNENFCLSTESLNTMANFKKNPSLDTIKEVPELRTSSESLFKIYSDTQPDSLDTDIILKNLKEFRNKNYFECHSTKSRIKNKTSVISIENHKCVYRFYLNERLFPVPLNTDCNRRIRCVECHLPMELRSDEQNDKINGTIQAKVELGDEIKDLMLLLPAKQPLIIKEKRKEERIEREEVYFGVIKLNNTGYSIFNSSCNESLALRYQKGFKQFDNGKPNYKSIEHTDVIYI